MNGYGCPPNSQPVGESRWRALIVGVVAQRHQWSLALAAGETMDAVSEVLGHADKRTTYTIYNHVVRSQRQSVAGTIGGLLMSHSDPDVTYSVTSGESEAPEEAPATLVHPWGFGPQTSRSAI
jgi:hypothetical protein